MRWKAFFCDRVGLPIWPLIPLLMVGLLFAPHSHTVWGPIAGIYQVIGLMAVAVRYWWAWVYGAPRFDWIVLMLLCMTMPAIAYGFVSTIARYVL